MIIDLDMNRTGNLLLGQRARCRIKGQNPMVVYPDLYPAFPTYQTNIGFGTIDHV